MRADLLLLHLDIYVGIMAFAEIWIGAGMATTKARAVHVG